MAMRCSRDPERRWKQKCKQKGLCSLTLLCNQISHSPSPFRPRVFSVSAPPFTCRAQIPRKCLLGNNFSSPSCCLTTRSGLCPEPPGKCSPAFPEPQLSRMFLRAWAPEPRAGLQWRTPARLEAVWVGDCPAHSQVRAQFPEGPRPKNPWQTARRRGLWEL